MGELVAVIMLELECNVCNIGELKRSTHLRTRLRWAGTHKGIRHKGEWVNRCIGKKVNRFSLLAS